MFYDTYLMLCNKIGKKPSAVATELKINKSNVSNWKSSGYTPRGEALQKIADHFHVSTDYLLGVTEQSQLDTAEFKVRENLRLWDAKLDFADNDEQRAEAEKEIKRLTEEQERLNAKIAETKKAPAPEGERKPSVEDLKLALFGGDGDVTDEMWEEALFAAEMIKARYKRKKAQDE